MQQLQAMFTALLPDEFEIASRQIGKVGKLQVCTQYYYCAA